MNPDVSTYPIEEIVPHRGRMRLLDIALSANESETVTEAVVREDWPGFSGGVLDPVILSEVVAQCTAAHIGWQHKIAGLPASIGWLAGIRNSRFFPQPIPAGTRLLVRVKLSYRMEGYAVFQGWVSAAGKPLAEIEVQTFEPDDIEALLASAGAVPEPDRSDP